MYHHRTCDIKTICYIVFISHSLHWRYIKTALQEYVIVMNKLLVLTSYAKFELNSLRNIEIAMKLVITDVLAVATQ